MKHGKKYLDSTKIVDRTKFYETNEALDLCVKTSKAKFDETIEAHIRLGVDSRHADQQVRGAVVLPNGTGKSVKVMVFAKGDKVQAALDAGADYAGGEEYVAKIQNEGFMDFDVVIASPDMMGVVGRLGKILGPRGLMPNPKLGTVTMDVAGAVKAVKAGQVEFRVEAAGQIHAGVGKISFDEAKIKENVLAFAQAVLKAKPASIKGTYLKAVALSTTQGAGVKVSVPNIASLASGK